MSAHIFDMAFGKTRSPLDSVLGPYASLTGNAVAAANLADPRHKWRLEDDAEEAENLAAAEVQAEDFLEADTLEQGIALCPVTSSTSLPGRSNLSSCITRKFLVLLLAKSSVWHLLYRPDFEINAYVCNLLFIHSGICDAESFR